MSPSPLRLAGVAFAHRPDVPLLIDVTVHLTGGWTAVVGANGAGKTTLLRLLAGELAPQAGVRTGPQAVAVCPQRTGPPDDALRAFAWGWTGDHCWALQAALDLDPAALDRWETLSWGERKRWQVGAALAARPQVLLLDEPSNHLDAGARALLARALAAFDGIGVLVSHDRTLLRGLATAVVRVADGRAEAFPGGWDAAEAQWALERAAATDRLQAASD
ncbi:MAG: ATP-binding cassette domain-containing protein, partial [Myxococcota bacterium]